MALRDALVEFEANRCSVPPGHAGATVEVRGRLGELHLEIYTPAAHRIAPHRGTLAGAQQPVRAEHASLLERAVLERFTTSRPCPRKPNRPPGERALAEAARLRGEQPDGGVLVDLEQFARLARVGRPMSDTRPDTHAAQPRSTQRATVSITSCASTSPTSSYRPSRSSSPPRSV